MRIIITESAEKFLKDEFPVTPDMFCSTKDTCPNLDLGKIDNVLNTLKIQFNPYNKSLIPNWDKSATYILGDCDILLATEKDADKKVIVFNRFRREFEEFFIPQLMKKRADIKDPYVEKIKDELRRINENNTKVMLLYLILFIKNLQYYKKSHTEPDYGKLFGGSFIYNIEILFKNLNDFLREKKLNIDIVEKVQGIFARIQDDPESLVEYTFDELEYFLRTLITMNREMDGSIVEVASIKEHDRFLYYDIPRNGNMDWDSRSENRASELVIEWEKKDFGTLLERHWETMGKSDPLFEDIDSSIPGNVQDALIRELDRKYREIYQNPNIKEDIDWLACYVPQNGTIVMLVDRIQQEYDSLYRSRFNIKLLYQKILLHELIHSCLDLAPRNEQGIYQGPADSWKIPGYSEESVDNALVLKVYSDKGNYLNEIREIINGQPFYYRNALDLERSEKLPELLRGLIRHKIS